jgi:hypothetical protein
VATLNEAGRKVIDRIIQAVEECTLGGDINRCECEERIAKELRALMTKERHALADAMESRASELLEKDGEGKCVRMDTVIAAQELGRMANWILARVQE